MITFKNVLLISVILSLAVFASHSQAGTYYVSPTGSATWSAATNINTPCSWQTAMTNAVSDDIVYFRGGTYDPGTSHVPDYEYPSINPAHSGTSGHPITFIAYPGEVPIINGNTSGTAFGSGHRDYIVWDGFTGQAAASSDVNFLFHIWYSTGSIVRNCNFTGVVHNDSTNFGLIRIESATNAEVYNNRLHDMRGSGVNTAAIWVFSSSNTSIYNNTIYNCANGIMQKVGPNISNSYYKNLIYTVTAYGMFLNEQTSGGTGIKIYQNILVNANDIHLEGVTSSAKINAYQVYNNTIYGSGSGITLTSYASNNQIWNNIISGANNPFLLYYSGAALPTYSDYNCFYHASSYKWSLDYFSNYTTISNWRAATFLDTNSVTTNPGFVNAGGTTALDYKRTSYPTNGRGGSYASVIGAYITGNEIIGATSSGSPPPKTPSPPSLLQIR